MKSLLLLLVVVMVIGVCCIDARPEGPPVELERDPMHPRRHKRDTTSPKSARSLYLTNEESAQYWKNQAQRTLLEHLNIQQNTLKAKNVIMFLGDGMSIPTLAAARVYQSQLEQSYGGSGEEGKLFFERFPFTGLSKTYCVDKQVADSACSATAYLCGVKANDGTIGVTAALKRGDCLGQANKTNHVESIAQWAQNAGKATGIVTTTRVTHASPSGTFAHIADRDWEADYHILQDGKDPKICPDIATQLVKNNPGKNFKVILGGGRKEFLRYDEVDEEGGKGLRRDGVNLIEEWKKDKITKEKSYSYVWNRTELLNVDISKTDYLLGLFENDHCQYHLDGNPELEPTLAEMTASAIKMLSKEKNGFFLFVEGGRIDHGHHDTLPKKALDETVQMANAVKVATELTNIEDTLIVVTSDHAHTMSYNGYAERGNDILSTTGFMADDKLLYATLSYANGPGYRKPDENGKRHDLSKDDMNEKDYKFPAMVPLSSETHGGDDVAVFALGPWSHLFTGAYEQNVIPHVMAYASCLGEGLTVCNQ